MSDPSKSHFGQGHRGLDGVRYDSRQEADVAAALDTLKTERVVSGYLPHAKIAGFDVDFLVQLGPEAGADTGTATAGRLVVLEYDGLGEERVRDLTLKVVKLGDLRDAGLELRWLTDPTIEGVRACLVNYRPPTFVLKTRICPECGTGDTVRVIARDRRNAGLDQLVQTRPCRPCKRMLKLGSLPD